MKFDIEETKRRLLVKYPMFGRDLASVTMVADPHIDTLGTDGKTIYYNETFLNQCSEGQQTFVFAHEVSHIAFRHIERCQGKVPYWWNIATDAVVNAFLKQDGLEIVEGGVDMPEAVHYDAEGFYEKLMAEQKRNQAQQDSSSKEQESSKGNSTTQDGTQGQSSDSSSQMESDRDIPESQYDSGHATHQQWGKAGKLKQVEPDKTSSKKKSSFWDKLFGRDTLDSQTKKNETQEEENLSDELAKLGEKEAFRQNAVERKKQLEELKNALVNQASGYGTTTASSRRIVEEVGKAKPLIEWRRLLREAIKYDIDWSYQNASIENGIVTPHLETFARPETEILLDTSGSIDTVVLRNFLRECKNILQTSKVFVGCFDTRFYGFQEIRTPLDIDQMQFHGGGGTDFDVAVNAFTRRVPNKIIFTDGEAPMPEQKVNAIWVVFGDQTIQPNGGRVIPITLDALQRLRYSNPTVVGKSKVKQYQSSSRKLL